jgi:hypothetical protein
VTGRSLSVGGNCRFPRRTRMAVEKSIEATFEAPRKLCSGHHAFTDNGGDVLSSWQNELPSRLGPTPA